ncbi:MAG: hypothetical protein HXM94_00615 [Parvimonas micra]|uniref:Uncharacterized protein n=1 Tax=Parvimonas micra TaxID=33033 RepID=A0A930H2Z4_9FIRM|nr:hypothetical protein [Parvimonas micra]MBF1306276.1 hypothetical protein [Parvimonas micra]
MENKLLKMKRLDQIIRQTGTWSDESKDFLNSVFNKNDIIRLSDNLFLRKSELYKDRYCFLIKKEFYKQIYPNLSILGDEFQFLLKNSTSGLEKELIDVVKKRLENENLSTETNKDDLISLNEIQGGVFDKLTLNDWLSKNFLVSKAISKVVFTLSVFISLLIIVYLQIVTNGFALSLKSLTVITIVFFVLIFLAFLIITEVFTFKNNNKKSFIEIQKKLLESTSLDKNDLKDELFEAILLEHKKLNENNLIVIDFGDDKIDVLHHRLYNETIVESIYLLNSPLYHFQKLLSIK